MDNLKKKWLMAHLTDVAAYGGLIFCILLFTIVTPIFGNSIWSVDKLETLVSNVIVLALMSVGAVFVYATGNMDISIGRQIGLWTETDTDDNIITGTEFAALSDEEAKQRVMSLKIISRAQPIDKERAVRILKGLGMIVAVTGDGTNDAPALNAANVGLSMGDGTAVAKEASDMTIIDNSFTTIANAVMWGRSLYKNIKRFILFQMTVNVAACLIVLIGAFIGSESPLTVTQMLWVNLIMDTFAAGALSSLPADKRVLHDKPRSHRAHIIDRGMAVTIGAWGLGFFVILVGIWQLLYHSDVTCVSELLKADSIRTFFTGFWSSHAQKAALSGYEHGIFFTTFVVLQFWNLFNTRYLRTDRCFLLDVRDFFVDRPRFKASFSSSFMLVALVIIAGQYLIVNQLPEFFEVEPLAMADWGVILAVTSPVFIVPEIWRSIRVFGK